MAEEQDGKTTFSLTNTFNNILKYYTETITQKKNDISDILINTEKEETKLDNMVCLKEPK